MRATKQRLSILRNKVTENLPNGNDIFGFQGISKELIIETINDAYEIVSTLDNFENRFEVVLLERKSSDYFDRISKLLKENFEEKKEDFNEFLNIISKLHFRIKETYISVVKEPIRAESQIQKAKEELSELIQDVTSIKTVYNEIKTIKQDSDDFISALKEMHDDALTKSETIKNEFSTIDNLKDDAENSANQIATWEKNIKDIKEHIASKTVHYEELKAKIEVLKNDTDINSEKNKEMIAVYENQIDRNNLFQEQIQKTIEDSNRFGMAGSFKKRKDELKLSLILWGVATIISIGVLIILSSKLLMEIKKEDIELGRIFARLPIFASCVWLGWFCAKQYGFTSRIMEDYSYKYAVSMAFEGYKNATKDIDPGLQLKLLELTIYNISNNPLGIYETINNHGTPFHELLKDLPKSFSFKKKINGVEAETQVGNK